MGFFKAVRKYAFNTANDSHYRKEQKRTHERAFEKTHKEIEKTKKSGRYINGAKSYKRNYSEIEQKLSDKHVRRGKFIDDLF